MVVSKLHVTVFDRYIAGQYLWPFIIAIGAFALIGVVDIIFYLIELSVLSGISFMTVVELIIYKLPALLVLFAPVGVLFSIMLLLVRMIKDSEYVVLVTSGVSVRRIIAPLLILSIITSGVAYFTNEQLVPWTNQKSEDLIAREIDRKPPPEIAEKVVFKGTDDRFFYVDQVNRKTGVMKSVIVFETTPQYPRIVIADNAQWGINTWHLWNGKIFEFNSNSDLEYTSRFSHMKINVFQTLDMLDVTHKSATEMDSRELKSRIASLEKSGIPTHTLRVEYGIKQAIPAACLVFGIIGIAFSLWFIKSGKDWWGVIIAIGVASATVMIYFFTLAVSRALGKGGSVSPFWGAWAANILFGSIGTALLYTKMTRR
ncbi:YjgP/YjgQ family permease [bacterium]|nr:YjgP/YjgQ family permease [bacterium]